MYKATVTCENYDGEMQDYVMYFHLSKKELLKLDAEVEEEGGMLGMLTRIQKDKKPKELMKFLDLLIDSSYGMKTDNGKFIKSVDILDDFKTSPAYDEYYFKLITVDGEADKFIDNVFPKDLMAQALEEIKKNPKILDDAGFSDEDISRITSLHGGEKVEESPKE